LTWNKARVTQNTVNLWTVIRQASHRIPLLQFINSRYSVWCLPYSRSQVHGILCDACLITVHEFTVFCVTLALFQVKSSELMNCNKVIITQNTVNLWTLIRPASQRIPWTCELCNSQVHGILCDACLIPGPKFTVFCVMLVLLQFIISRYSGWCLPYYSSQVHGILCDAGLISWCELMNWNETIFTQNIV
jgi:hypothetical protein